MMRRDFIRKNNIQYDPRYYALEDRKFWIDVLAHGGQIASIPEVLIQMRIHATNPADYYRSQNRNAYQLIDEELIPLFHAESVKGFPKCLQFKEFIKQNQKHPIVDQVLLEKHIKAMCPTLTGEPVKHVFWQDAFVFQKGNRVCREKAAAECGTIINRTDTSFTLKWDRWGPEVFEKNPHGFWIVKE